MLSMQLANLVICDTRYTPEQYECVRRRAAAGIVEGEEVSDEDRERITRAFESISDNVLGSDGLPELTRSTRNIMEGIRRDNDQVSGEEVVTRTASSLFQTIGPSLQVASEEGSRFLKAVWYYICLFVSTLVGIALKIIKFCVKLISTILEAAWKKIKAVIRFTWELFLKVVKSPVTWGVVTGFGAGAAVTGYALGACAAVPAVGLTIAAVGLIGIYFIR